jgi:hypothetical protein
MFDFQVVINQLPAYINMYNRVATCNAVWTKKNIRGQRKKRKEKKEKTMINDYSMTLLLRIERSLMRQMPSRRKSLPSF